MTLLTVVTVVFGAVLLTKGFLILFGGASLGEKTKALLYNRPAGATLWLIAVAWTLWEVVKLGPADFGSFKVPLFVIFSALGLASLWMLKDYLIVRAFCVLTLYVAWWVLKTAYMQEAWTRLFVVTAVYVAIIKALYLIVAPWRARGGLAWVYEKKERWQSFSYFYLGYGALLMIVAATYHLV